MTRCRIWIGIIVGGALYQATKGLLGFPTTWESTWFSSVYWSGAALVWHWLANKTIAAKLPNQVKQ